MLFINEGSSVVSQKFVAEVAERGARLARRDDREY